MNTIIVGSYEKNIEPYLEEFCGVSAYPNFIFDEFKLIFDDEFWGKVKTVVKLQGADYEKMDGQSICYFGGIKLIGYSNNYEETGNYHTELASEDGVFYFENGTNGDNYDRGEQIYNIMQYIMWRLKTRERTTKEVTHKAHFEKQDENVVRKNASPNKEIFLIDEITDYLCIDNISSDANQRQIQCPCWSVRGHYRHYKSGKVIFVENYKKGKNRDKTEPKSKIYTV